MLFVIFCYFYTVMMLDVYVKSQKPALNALFATLPRLPPTSDYSHAHKRAVLTILIFQI